MMNNCQFSNMGMNNQNNSNNQNNNNDFPDQSKVAQIFNQQNKMNNQNMMMNNNMNMNMMNNNMRMSNRMGINNNSMSMMNNNMNNNIGMMNNNNMGMMNNNMGMMNNNNMGMMNNNMSMMNNNVNNNGLMNNNMGMINNNMSNNMNNNSMGMMNNNMGNNNMNMMNNNLNNNNMGMINNNMSNNNMKNMQINNMQLLQKNMNNNNMGNNNMCMNNCNNMALVKYKPINFQINWFNTNFIPHNMNSQNNIFIMNYFRNQILQRQYYQMMFQQRMFYQMQKIIYQRRLQRMQEILERGDVQNSNDQDDFVPLNLNQNDNNNDNYDDNFVPNQALMDVIQENNPPQQNNNNNQNPNNPILTENLVSEIIADVINLNPNLLSGLGNNLSGEWAQGENRGGRPYKPPNGWIGYGLNVLNKYDNGNNDWLACNGRPGEWCIAYHGACNGQSSDNVKKGIKSILETNLRPGGGQAYRDADDANHPGQKVGVGVYCSPEPSVIDGYAGTMNINGHNYRAAFMLRVKPDKLRYSSSQPNYWVVDGSFDQLRPYRLLIKPC